MILLPAPPCVFAKLRLRGCVCRLVFAGFARTLSPATPYQSALLGCLVAALLLAASRTHTQRTGRLHRQQQEQTRHHND